MMASEFSAQVKANGFPVRRRAYENGKLADEETLVKIWREEAVPRFHVRDPRRLQGQADANGAGAITGSK